MNTKFTKGPWFAEQIIERDDVFLDICAEDSSVVSDVGVNGATEEQRRANAALIASAPELYEALEVLAAYPLEAFGKYGAKPDTPLFGANGWLLTVGDVLNARTALKKALGEA